MKTDRVAITKGNYKENILKRAIIICWILLAICFIVKLCGGNFFAIACHNEKFISICNFVDNSLIRYIIYFIFFMFESIMIYGIITGGILFKKKETIIYIILCVIYWCFKLIVDLKIINLDTMKMSLIGMVYLLLILEILTRKYWLVPAILILDIVLVSLCTYIKNISFYESLSNSFLLDSIFMIDYYISLILSYLYSKRIKQKKEV